MADQFDRFTEQAKRALVRSQQEAQRLHHTHIGTEHLLLGLAREEAGRPAGVLGSLGVDVERGRREVLRLTGGGSPPRPASPAA
jgi:ATP-dependent Clp protease ATP-binding subunit ClpC